MIIPKGIIILAQTEIFNDGIREWRRKSTDFKTWAKYKCFSHQAHQEQKRAVTTAGKWGYTARVQNIYGAPPPSPEEHHQVIEDIQKIMQAIQTQGYDLEGLPQSNAVLASYNYVLMAQLIQMTVTMNVMQAQLKHSPLHKPTKPGQK